MFNVGHPQQQQQQYAVRGGAVSLPVRPATAGGNNNAALSPGPSSSGVDRLRNVKLGLQHLSETIEATTAPSAAQDDTATIFDMKFATMRDTGSKIEQHIALEVKRRAEGDRALQRLIEGKAQELAIVMDKKVSERLIQMQVTIDQLSKKVGKLNQDLAEERDKNVRLTQELRFHSTQGLEDIRKEVEAERGQRQEKEGLIVKKLSEDVFRVQERLDVERHARETMVHTVRTEISSAKKYRDKHDEKILARLREDVSGLERRLREEQEERVRSEESIAAAMEGIVQQVQAGLTGLMQ